MAACGGEGGASLDAPRSCAETATPHDEDGDGVLDACDNCPAIVNPTQSDAIEIDAHAFADGVGDACDLRPRVGGDTLRAFYSFESAMQASAWTGSGFTISDDAAHATATASWTSTQAWTGDGLVVVAHVSSAELGTTGELAVALDGDGLGVGTTCTLSAQQLVVREIGGASSAVGLAPAIEPMQPVIFVAWRAVVVTPTGRATMIRCRVTFADASQEATLPLADDLITGTYAIAARDALLDITSVSVYTSPGPKNP